MDELADKLEALRQEEQELLDTIGESLAIIQGVRDGMPNGEKYGDVLESRYIDNEQWQDIADRYESNRAGNEGKRVAVRTVQGWATIACEWIDSIGVSRILRGVLEV